MPARPLLLLLLVAVLAVLAVPEARAQQAQQQALSKCCPSGQQLSIDLVTCTPLGSAARQGGSADTFYSTESAGGGAKDRSRRDAEDWGWLPEDALITDASNLRLVTLDELRREARDAAPGPRLPRVDWGAPPPCPLHERELLFWDSAVQLFSNGSLLVHQDRADLFRPGDSPQADEGTRSFLFPPGSFCMDRLTLRSVVAVPLDRETEKEVHDAVLEEEEEELRRDNRSETAHTLPPDQDPDTHHVILLCPCSASGARCVRKCCLPRSVLVVDAAGDTDCQADQERDEEPVNPVASAAAYNRQKALRALEWGPSQHRNPDYPESELFLLHSLPHCSNPEGRRFLLDPASSFNSTQAMSQFWIMGDGSAMVDIFGVDTPLPAGKFCGEIALDAASGLRAPNLLVCSDPGVLVAPRARILYGVLAATGAAFLAATLLVHACLPELRRSLHSSNLMAHTGSLLLAYIALTVNSMAGPGLPRVACLLLAFVLQFSFLAAFFWLNVMCVDISWAFSGLRLPQGSAAERDRKKFLWYSLYAWGGTALITTVTAVINFLPVSSGAYVLHPQIGVVYCWFKEYRAVLLYFYGPMAFLLLANLALFVYTAARILAVRKDTAILHKPDSARTQHHETQRDAWQLCLGALSIQRNFVVLDSDETERDHCLSLCLRPGPGAECRLVLYVKLFCLMGLTWITEIISWASGGRDYYWYATDAVNLLRAAFIFIIFCCKRKVLRLVVNRLAGEGAGGGSGDGSRGRGGAGPRGRGGRGTGTITSSLQTGSLTIHQDARRLQHMSSQDSAVGSNTTTVTSPSANNLEGFVLSIR